MSSASTPHESANAIMRDLQSQSDPAQLLAAAQVYSLIAICDELSSLRTAIDDFRAGQIEEISGLRTSVEELHNKLQ